MKLQSVYDLPQDRVKKFLYEMLEEREPHVNISHRTLPSKHEHERFINAKLYRAWFIITDNEEWVGNCYLTQSLEIGIFIRKEWQGKGLGNRAVRDIMEKFGPARFLANIAPTNPGSQDFFRKLGFKCIQYTFEIET